VRRVLAALCIIGLMVAPACTRDAARVVGGYWVDGDKVFWFGGIGSSATVEVVGADADSFDPLGNTYARDRSRVYHQGQVLADADPSSFDLIDHNHAKDRSHVWYGDHLVSDDPTHFVLLDGGMAKDSKAVYCDDGEVLTDDPAHFEILRASDTDTGTSYTKDSRTVYHHCQPIPGADVATFRLLDTGFFGYAVDARHVYLYENTIPGADPRTFRILYNNEWCAADDQHAYKRDAVIPNVNPAAFPAGPGKTVTGCSETEVTFGP
jgi:DKNYY family